MLILLHLLQEKNQTIVISPFENFESQECYLTSLVDIDFKIMKEVFKLRTCTFTNLRISPLWKGCGSSFLKKKGGILSVPIVFSLFWYYFHLERDVDQYLEQTWIPFIYNPRIVLEEKSLKDTNVLVLLFSS